MRDRVPHLALRTGEAIGVVGPLVRPGSSACLNCVDLHKAEADPLWPKILAQATFARSRPQACDTVLAAMTATLASAQALAYIDRPQTVPVTADGTLEVVLPDWQWRRRTWLPHPACDCGAFATLSVPSAPAHAGQCRCERRAQEPGEPGREDGQAADRAGGPDGYRDGEADRRAVGRDRRAGNTAAHGRPDLPGPGRAQGRRHEAGPGAVDLRGGAAARDRRALPGHADQAAGVRAAATRPHRAPGAGQGTRRGLAGQLRRVQRHARRRGVHRPGTQGRLVRRPAGRGEDPVPRRGARADRRLHPAEPGRAAVRPADARAGRQAAAR